MSVSARVSKRSCAFCQSEERDALEASLLAGEFSAKQLDKDMSWRANTADRHFRNHMGEYHMAAIADELEVAENTVYHHMKHHFQPLVQKSAAIEVAFSVGQELNLLRSNAERLNYKLSELLSEGSVHEDGFVRDAVSLHKEVRETVKDLLKFNDQWGGDTTETTINQTINVLKVELAKESPDSWKRIKQQLLENTGGETFEADLH
jgi:hypothetical protein